MATRYVNTGSTAGGDGTTNNTSGSTRAYATLNEALTALGNLSEQTTIYCTGATADTTPCTQTDLDFTTTAANYLAIIGERSPNHFAPTLGRTWNTGLYRLVITNSNAFYNNIPGHIRIEGIQLEMVVTDTGNEYIGLRQSTANNQNGPVDHRISYCIARKTGAGSSVTYGFFNSDPTGSGGTLKGFNNLAYDLSYGFAADGSTWSQTNCRYLNCTAADCGSGNYVNDQRNINCLSQGSAGFVATTASGSSNNASSDGSAVGTNSRTNQTFTFVDSASDDWGLASGDAGARGYGTVDPESGLYSDDATNFTRGGSWDIGAFEFPLLLEQEGFRWGVDDGNEAAHTWEANQDTSISIADTQARLLRVLVNATGDPAATAYTLRAQKNGSGGYTKVNVGASSSPTLSYGATGTIAYSASGGTSVAPTYPTGITPNSCLVLVVGQKPSSANGGSVTTPSGWTLQGQNTGATDGDTGGYTTTLGVDTGNTNIYVYTKDTVLGTESGTLTVTVATNNVCWANIYRIESSDVATWSYAVGVGKDTTGGNVSIATGSMAIAAGDYLLAGMVIPTDVTTPSQFTSQALSQSGTTFGTVTEVQEPDSPTGNDIGGFIVEAPVSSGSGSGAVTLTATAGGTTTNVRGPGFVFRARATAITNEVYIDASANITAGGEATTARLTAPSGKTTSDFVTGRRWDDENGTDTIDITTDDYTEVEWKVALSSTPADNDYYDFRVYAGATNALDTYTQLPRWTVAAAGGGTVPHKLMLLGVGF